MKPNVGDEIVSQTMHFEITLIMVHNVNVVLLTI